MNLASRSGGAAIRADPLKASTNLAYLALRLLTKRTTPRFRNTAPVLVFAVLVAGRHDAPRSTGIESKKAMIRSADAGLLLP